MDSIAVEARKLADRYAAPALNPDLVRAEDAAAASIAFAEGTSAAMEIARQHLSKQLGPFLDAIAIDAVRGGRNSDVPRKIFARIVLGYTEGNNTVNLFMDKLGVEESEAKVAVSRWREATELDEHTAASTCAVFLGGYLKLHPERRDQLLETMGIAPASPTNGDRV